MTKQVLYAQETGAILDWQDTDIYSYAEPIDGTSLAPVTDQQWAEHGSWKSVKDGLLSPSEPNLSGGSLDSLKASVSSLITESCLAAIDGGFAYNGHRYDSDLVSRTNIIGTATGVQAGIPLPEGFTWRTSDNENVPIDGPGVITLGAALLRHVNTQYAISWQLKAQIDAATTPEDVAAISWPPAP